MDPLTPLAHPDRQLRRRPRRPRVLRVMLAGSVLLHLFALLSLWWTAPETPPDVAALQEAETFSLAFDDKQPIQDKATGVPAEASTQSSSPSQAPSVARGNEAAPVAPPSQDVSLPAPTSQEPPSPTVEQTPSPATPPAEPPEAPPSQPVQEASIAPLESVAPTVEPPPPPKLPSRAPPATVTLHPDDEGFPRPQAFVMPQPPPPLPTLPPRPAPSRHVARPTPQNPFSKPQDWSLNAFPSQPSSGRPSRGFDTAVAPLGSERDQVARHVGGADPGVDWYAAVHRIQQPRVYYPEAAVPARGRVSVLVRVERSGRVTSVRVTEGSGNPFLDGAWVDIWRNQTLPPLPASAQGDYTDNVFTIDYYIVRR